MASETNLQCGRAILGASCAVKRLLLVFSGSRTASRSVKTDSRRQRAPRSARTGLTARRFGRFATTGVFEGALGFFLFFDHFRARMTFGFAQLPARAFLLLLGGRRPVRGGARGRGRRARGARRAFRTRGAGARPRGRVEAAVDRVQRVDHADATRVGHGLVSDEWTAAIPPCSTRWI